VTLRGDLWGDGRQPPRPAGSDTYRTDRGYSSATRYFDDGSQVMIAHQDYVGVAIEWRPRNNDQGRTSQTRGIWWEDNDPTIAWLDKQAAAMPDHIWQILVEDLPHFALTPRSSTP
jgi:hypothetical protein